MVTVEQMSLELTGTGPHRSSPDSREVAAYSPDAKPGQDKGEADKDRCFVPLEWPVPTVRLIDLNFTVLGEAHLVWVASVVSEQEELVARAHQVPFPSS